MCIRYTRKKACEEGLEDQWSLQYVDEALYFSLLVQTYGNPNVTYDWWAGNSGTASRSGKFLAAHAAHAGLMVFWAGAFTLFELARYDPSIAMGHQQLILLPHLATLGMGVGEGGVITDTHPIIVVAVMHLISSGVLAGGGLLHSIRLPGDLGKATGRAQKFDFDWKDPSKLTFILGHHLIFLGLGNIQFVEWAKYHGIWDTSIGAVRTVEPNIDLGMVWGMQSSFLTINSLEDVMGGHGFLAFFLIIGGVWHIISKPFGKFDKGKGSELLSGEAVLSYSLAGIAYMAFVAAFWCATNTTVYPTEFYGEVLKLQFDFSPYFADTWADRGDLHTARAWLSNVHFYLGFFFLQGHLWHALRAMGFDFKRVEKAFDGMETAKVTAAD